MLLSGQTTACTKVNGEMTAPVAEVVLRMLLQAMYLKENGTIMKRMDTVYRKILMVPPTRGTGRMISMRAMVNSHYKMAPCTRVISEME